MSLASITILGHPFDATVEVLNGRTEWETPGDTRWKKLLLHYDLTVSDLGRMPTLQAYFRTVSGDKSFEGRFPSVLANTESDRGHDASLLKGAIVCFFKQYCLAGVLDEDELDAMLMQTRAEKSKHSSGLGYFFEDAREPCVDYWKGSIANAQKHRWEIVHDLRSGSRGRSFFTTNGYMGTGPPYAKPGDKVCIIQGAIVPLLLRTHPDKEGYLLVGEAFVMGLMDGEYKGGFEEIVTH